MAIIIEDELMNLCIFGHFNYKIPLNLISIE